VEYSIGELIDKLVIENIKIFRLRQEYHDAGENSEAYQKLMSCIENRSVICKSLDNKIDRVLSGKTPNRVLKDVRTY